MIFARQRRPYTRKLLELIMKNDINFFRRVMHCWVMANIFIRRVNINNIGIKLLQGLIIKNSFFKILIIFRLIKVRFNTNIQKE